MELPGCVYVMTIEVDKYLDRTRLKASRSRWRIIAIFAIFAILVLVLGKFTLPGKGDHVAVIDINNIIIDDPDRDRTLKMIARDPKVKALMIRISSPGGTVTGAESLYYFLRSVSEKKTCSSYFAGISYLCWLYGCSRG